MPRRDPTAAVLPLLRATACGAGRVLPRAVGALAYRLYRTPLGVPAPDRERAALERARHFPVAHAGRVLRAFAWGPEGARATVLLVHGWSGRGAQLAPFFAPLVARGYRVVAFDAPAHGLSDGGVTDIADFSAAVGSVARAVLAPGEALAALLTHSFGGPCAAVALRDGVPARALVTIGSPAHLGEMADRFARFVRLPEPARRDFRGRVEARLGADCWERYDVATLKATLPTLIVHDADDRDVPVGHAVDLARAWPDATLHLTRGLGHTRVLRDPSVVARVVDFIATHSPASSSPAGSVSASSSPRGEP